MVVAETRDFAGGRTERRQKAGGSQKWLPQQEVDTLARNHRN
jgi:hypothetical protein